MPKGYWVSVYRTISDPRGWLRTTSWPVRPSRPGAVGPSSVAVGLWRMTPESPGAPS